MSARIAGLIDRLGQSVGIYRKTAGALDSYGDTAEDWTLQATENMLIQAYSRSMIRQTDTVLAAAGRLKNIEKLAYTKNSSVAASGDYLLVDSVKWRIVHVEPLVVGSSTHVKVACLSKFT